MKFVTFYIFLSFFKIILSLKQLAFSDKIILKRINELDKNKYDIYLNDCNMLEFN
jgi:hypothetical protein